jgi:hypothetical protein
MDIMSHTGTGNGKQGTERITRKRVLLVGAREMGKRLVGYIPVYEETASGGDGPACGLGLMVLGAILAPMICFIIFKGRVHERFWVWCQEKHCGNLLMTCAILYAIGGFMHFLRCDKCDLCSALLGPLCVGLMVILGMVIAIRYRNMRGDYVFEGYDRSIKCVNKPRDAEEEAEMVNLGRLGRQTGLGSYINGRTKQVSDATWGIIVIIGVLDTIFWWWIWKDLKLCSCKSMKIWSAD